MWKNLSLSLLQITQLTILHITQLNCPGIALLQICKANHTEKFANVGNFGATFNPLDAKLFLPNSCRRQINFWHATARRRINFRQTSFWRRIIF